jgi:hypothetical protein
MLSSLVCSCQKNLTAEAIEKSAAALVQRGPRGASTWIVAPDGVVNATLKTPDGQPVTQPVTGTMAFTPPEGPPMTVPVHYDPKTGVLTAAGPKLDADITPVTYNLDVGGTPWTGAIDVPKGGTLDLVETAKLQPPVPPPPPNLPDPPTPPTLVGPHGGVVQVVGPDRIELVPDRPSASVRAYVLDPDNHPIDPGDRRITIALEGEQPEVLVLAPEPQGHFVVAPLRTRIDPVHVTVAVNAHGHTHACLVGWSPGTVVVVGPEAPRAHFLVEPPVMVEVPGHHGHHHVEYVGAPGVVVGTPGVVVEPPSVAIGGPPVVVGAPGVFVSPPGLAVSPPGVVVGGPNVVVGGPGVVVGGPRVVGPPGVVVGPPGVRAGWEHEHDRGDRDHDHDRGHKGR